MREGWPSITALGVAMFRAIASAPGSRWDVDDPVAKDLLPFPFSLGRALGSRRLTQPIARVLSMGLLDHVALRTVAIDRELREALAAGARQLVILGAGLDARAWRMRELADATVFEVDVASTQAIKRARLEQRPASAREVRFVTVDFGKGELDAKLAASGHDPARTTAWIWEGVTPYLPRDAVRATLSTIASRSAVASTLIVSYATPEQVRVPAPLVRGPVRRAFALLGEPLVGALETADLHALVRAAGFDVVHDRGSLDWARPRAPIVEITERVATALRR